MSNRLNQEREAELQPKRILSCTKSLRKLGFTVRDGVNGLGFPDHTKIDVTGYGISFQFWPYSGWWSGKKLGSGRGYKKLIARLKQIGVLKSNGDSNSNE